MPEETKGGNQHGEKLSPLDTINVFTLQEPQQCHIHDAVEDTQAESIREEVCVNDEPLNEFEGNFYCLFHLPTKKKKDEFWKKFRARLEEVEEKIAAIGKLPLEDYEEEKSKLYYRFEYVWFPEVSLKKYEFKVGANFNFATFSSGAYFAGAVFSSGAYFNSAVFSGEAYFRDAAFLSDVYFSNAIFSGNAFFRAATFLESAQFFETTFSSGVDFIQTTFLADALFADATFSGNVYFKSTMFFSGEAYFGEAKFDETSQVFFNQTCFRQAANFNQTAVKGYMYFEAGESDFFNGEWLDDRKTKPKMETLATEVFENTLDFSFFKAENPERITFDKVRLQPGWFVNTDSRKFVFTDCRWRTANKEEIDTKTELQSLSKPSISNANKLLTKTCWQLAENYEEMKHFSRASKFRQIANESMRLKDFGGFNIWSLHWWYWLSSFYGERWRWALGILLAILFIFTFLYSQTNFQVCSTEKTDAQNNQPKPCEIRTLDIWEAGRHSLATAAFQNVENRKPVTGPGETFIILEKIFAPLQAALLALAIRRKFMR